MTKGLILGIGNPDRGDDGIGPLVARRLIGRVPAGIAVRERTGDALALIEDWAGHAMVVLVDAAAPVTSPGCIHRLDLLQDTLATEVVFASTHGFGVAEAVGLARTLGLLPAHLIAYAIEGASFAPGAAMTPEVSAAADIVVARIAMELPRLEGDNA